MTGRTKFFKRRQAQTGAVVEYAVTPEAALARHEKMAKKLIGPGRPPRINQNDGLPTTYQPDAPHIRARRARGEILAVHRITGETPDEIMVRLGFTDEDILRIYPFKRTVTWS